jgi:hypothetical protein
MTSLLTPLKQGGSFGFDNLYFTITWLMFDKEYVQKPV